MPNYSLSETAGEIEVRVLDGMPSSDYIFDELGSATENSGTVVMDFVEVPYVNAVFLCALTRLKKALDREGRELAVKNVSEELQQIFDCVKFHKLRTV